MDCMDLRIVMCGMWVSGATFEGCPVSARGRARSRPRTFKGPDLPSPAVDALRSRRDTAGTTVYFLLIFGPSLLVWLPHRWTDRISGSFFPSQILPNAAAAQ